MLIFSQQGFALLKRYGLITVMLPFLVLNANFASADDDDESEEKHEAIEKQQAAVEQALQMASHEAAVHKLVVSRNISITYDYIALLMRLPNAFGEGAACVICHSSNDPEKSYRGLDLSTCEGILKGSAEIPARKVVIPGKPKKGLVRRHLRNNRMPFGVAFDYPTDTPNILTVKKWIDNGAREVQQGGFAIVQSA
jgi:hypothetical protein